MISKPLLWPIPRTHPLTFFSAAIAPYSPATVANGLVFCSGQVPIDLNAKIIDGSITDMTRQCIHNLKAVLEAAGSSIEKVTKVS